jgi:CubicO group peptidase (beta-lactamase class C family)
VWVKASQTGTGCFADYVARASRTQIPNESKKAGASFDGYGYMTWTENLQRRDSYWAVGHGGQRIGWNHANTRMVIAFSNVEDYMGDLYKLYAEWASLSD